MRPLGIKTIVQLGAQYDSISRLRSAGGDDGTGNRDFRNAPKLTSADIQTLVAWADTGAREGDPADKPAPVEWKDGWRIKPDVVISMPEAHVVPAKGIGEIQSFFVPNPFKEDTWVTSIEIRPGDPAVVHHVIVQIPEQT